MVQLQSDDSMQEEVKNCRIELTEQYMILGAGHWKLPQEIIRDCKFLSEGQSESKRDAQKEFMFPRAGQEIKATQARNRIKATQARNRIKATQARNRIKATQAWDGTYLCFAIVCGFVPGLLVTIKTGNPDAGFIVAIISAIIVPIALIFALG